ncbi:xanthine dehydrogenase accessory protein XdhC [Paracoccus aurantiacus]|uniref:Xanthine dehydrogenase accessory protein XdhC n=1 Tax=Paracoccus aurantiacus TaxID=2599412 RepID=A0A5C6S6F2_9RHOB|nr:xanthine dehydrogenase accessory protein XdhC [Paracoccus aurantiacus]TXB69995.1 xanthine dehydrogenase accessory protein XdhC [Paracoccus aurantiacus]
MIRVRVTKTVGSTPREVGAEMIVTTGTTTGTIGGGRLELDAIAKAREMIASGAERAEMLVTLGPESGQCCGGRVQLALDRLPASDTPEQPQVMIFGAGHVGRALAQILSALPFDVILIDSRPEELNRSTLTENRLTPLPETEIRAARPGAAFVILTHDHGLDFLLAAEALKRGDAAYVGLIGSATKRARFLREARAAGIDASALTCPIGAGFSADKRPEIIAAFTAAEIAGKLTATATAD